jgi:hypothetical protein
MALSTTRNSTNVRNESPLDPWPIAVRTASRAPALVLAAWTGFVAVAGIEGVFARLETGAYFALAAFVLAYAVIASRVDADVTAFLERVKRPLAFAFVLDALVLAGPIAGGAPTSTWSMFPGALLFLVALPSALVLHAEALRRPRLRKAAAESPGARRAAT